MYTTARSHHLAYLRQVSERVWRRGYDLVLFLFCFVKHGLTDAPLVTEHPFKSLELHPLIFSIVRIAQLLFLRLLCLASSSLLCLHFLRPASLLPSPSFPCSPLSILYLPSIPTVRAQLQSRWYAVFTWYKYLVRFTRICAPIFVDRHNKKGRSKGQAWRLNKLASNSDLENQSENGNNNQHSQGRCHEDKHWTRSQKCEGTSICRLRPAEREYNTEMWFQHLVEHIRE